MYRRLRFYGGSSSDTSTTYQTNSIFARSMALFKKLTTRNLAFVLCGVLSIGLVYSIQADPPQFLLGGRPSELQRTRQAAVADAFQHAWDGYSKYCFARDTLHPVSNTCEDNFGGYGATAIDSLSTAILLGKEDIVLQILEFISTVDWRKADDGYPMQVFEITIRHFAAMISAWDLLNGPFSSMAQNSTLRDALYNQTVTLGDVLCCAFDAPSGVPRSWINPATCKTDERERNAVAGVGTIILEFARLSNITGNTKYVSFARRAEEYLLRPQPGSNVPYPGLLGSFVKVKSGSMMDSKGSWGAFADSFYEYLLKAYIYDSDFYGFYLERWQVAADSTITYIGSHPYGYPELTFLPTWNGQYLHNSMEALSWFAGGNFILGGMITNNQTLVDYGLSIADAAGAVYSMTTTGLGGEFVTWTTACDASTVGSNKTCDPQDAIKITDARFRLRPEVLETWYYAYRATRDAKYREWSWAAFEAINRYCRTDSGFSAIDDVNAVDGGKKTDVQESFVFAEVMKYVYLTHLENRNMPYHVQDSRSGMKNTWVFNTEAHPLRIAGPPV